MVLVVHSVRLKDFINHEDTLIEFPTGVTAIVGDNGVGKTSIIDAVIVAFGDKEDVRVRGRKSNLVRHGASKASITVEFLIGNKRYCVERTVSLKETELPADRKLFEYVNGKKKLLVIGSRVLDELYRVMGVKPKTINTVAVLRQGRLHELIALFSSGKKVKKKELIDELLDLYKYREAYEKIKDLLTYYVETPDKARLKISPTRNDVNNLFRLIEQSKNKIGVLSREISDLKVRLTDMKKEYSTVEEKIENIVNKVNMFKSRRDELLREVNILYEKNRRLKELYVEKDRLEKELKELLAQENALVERIKLLEKYVKLHDIVVSIESLMKDYSMAVKEKEEYEEIYNKLKRVKELDAIGVKEKLSKYNRLKEELVSLNARLEQLLKHKDSIVGEISSVKKEVDSVDKEVESYLERIKGRKLEDLDGAISKVGEEKAKLMNRIEELENIIDALNKAEAVCPVCKRRLTKEHRERLLKENTSELEFLKKKLMEVDNRYKELVEEKAELKTLYDGLNSLRSRREALIDSLKKKEAELSRISSELKDLRERKESVEREIDVYERENIEELGREYEVLIATLDKYGVSDLPVIEDKLSKSSILVNKIKEDIDRQYRVLSQELGLDLDTLYKKFDKVKEKLSKAREKYDKALNTLNNEIKPSIRSCRDQLANIVDEIKVIEEEVKEKDLDSMERELKIVEEELSKVEEEHRSLYGKKEKLEALIGEYEGRVKEREEELSRHRSFVDKAMRIYRIVSTAYRLREEVIRIDRAPEAIRSKALRVIEEEASRILNSFELDYTVLRITDDLDIVASSPYTTRSLPELSGGEQVAVIIALILALHRVVSKGKLGLLVLDEPTIHLDEERRRKLIEIFKNFRGGHIIPQLIVITHNREVEDAADQVYEVTKQANGVSRVKPI